MRMKSASAAAGEASAVEVKGVKLLVQRVDGLERGPMRDLVDQMRGKLGSGVVVLGAAADGKVALIVGVTKDLTAKVQAGEIVGTLAGVVWGKGGGGAGRRGGRGEGRERGGGGGEDWGDGGGDGVRQGRRASGPGGGRRKRRGRAGWRAGEGGRGGGRAAGVRHDHCEVA